MTRFPGAIWNDDDLPRAVNLDEVNEPPMLAGCASSGLAHEPAGR
jgi:hypothetical protein